MGLIAHLTIHFVLAIIAGLIAGFVWKRFITSIVVGILAGFFIDVDHAIDYVLAFGGQMNIDYFLKGYQFLKADTFYIFFHGWEYIGICLVVVGIVKNVKVRSIMLAAALGMFFHLSADVFLNNIPARSYAISYRIGKQFKIEHLVTPEHYQRHMEEKNTVQF